MLETFRGLTEYGLYEDLRRGWRVIQFNLEEVGLLRVEYASLTKMAGRDEMFNALPALAGCPPRRCEEVFRAVLDHFRKRLAVEARILQKTAQQKLRRCFDPYLNEFWGLDPDVPGFRKVTVMVRPGKTSRASRTLFLSSPPALSWDVTSNASSI